MTDPSPASSVPAASPPDRRLVYFRWFLAAGIFSHSYMWLGWQMTHPEGILGYPQRWAWTPGVFLPTGIHLTLNWGLFLAAALYLALGSRPQAAARVLLALAVIHFLGLPERVPNHFVVILFGLGVLSFTPSGTSDRPSPLTLTLLRHLCAFTYFFAFFHKLNRDYFSLERSPLWVLDTVLRSLGLHDRLYHDPTFFRLGLVASLLAELSIPILLFLRPTRIFAVVAGLAFHGAIALADAPDYTMVILAFYVTFLDADQARQIAARLRERPAARIVQSLVAAALGVRVSYVYSDETLRQSENIASELLQTIGLFIVFGVIWYFFVTIAPLLWRRMQRAPAASAAVPRPAPAGGRPRLAVVIGFQALYALNCLAPYLGIKYYDSQEMFSGLNVDASNHYLMPQIGLIDNHDRFLGLLDIQFDDDRAAALQPRSAPLYELRDLRGKWVEGNFMRSVLWHACHEGGLGPIGVRYRVQRQAVSVRDVCPTDLHYHPLNLYPYAPAEAPFVVRKGEDKPSDD